MSWMVQPILFSGYAPDAKIGMAGMYSRDCQNVKFNIDGGIETVAGFTGNSDHTASADFITDIYVFNRGTAYDVVGWISDRIGATGTNTRLYKLGSSFTFLSGLTTATAKQAYFTVLGEKLLVSVSDGTTRPEIWTGGASTSLSAILTSPEGGRYSATHYNRAFLAYSGTYKSRVWWSDLYDPAEWDTTVNGQWLDVNRDDGDIVTGIRPYAGDLIVYKNNSAYKILGNDFDPTNGNFSVVGMEGVPGCLYHESIVEANGELYWYSPQGFVKFGGGSVTPIGFGFVDESVRTAISAPRTKEEQVSGVYRPNLKEIWWIIGDGSIIYTYSVVTGKWGKVTTPHPISAITHDSIYNAGVYGFQNATFFGGGLSAAAKPAYYSNIEGTSYYNWNGTAIDSYYNTDYMDLGVRQRKGSPRFLFYPDANSIVDLSTMVYVDAPSGVHLSAGVYCDYDPLPFDSVVFNTGDVYFEDKYCSMQSFRRIKIKLATNILSKKFIMNKMEIEFNADTESGRI